MAFRRRKRQHVDDTRAVLDEAEVNRKRLIMLAGRLSVMVDELRELTAAVASTQARQEHEGGASGG